MRYFLLILSIVFSFVSCRTTKFDNRKCVTFEEYFPLSSDIFGIRFYNGIFDVNIDDRIEYRWNEEIDRHFSYLINCVDKHFFVDMSAYPLPYVRFELDGSVDDQWFFCDILYEPGSKCKGNANVANLRHDCSDAEIFLIVVTPDMSALGHELIHYVQYYLGGYMTEDRNDPFWICEQKYSLDMSFRMPLEIDRMPIEAPLLPNRCQTIGKN